MQCYLVHRSTGARKIIDRNRLGWHLHQAMRAGIDPTSYDLVEITSENAEKDDSEDDPDLGVPE